MSNQSPKSTQEKTVMALGLFFVFGATPFLISAAILKHKVEGAKYNLLEVSSEKIISYKCTSRPGISKQGGFKITMKTEIENKSNIYIIPYNPSCLIDSKWATGKTAKIYQSKRNDSPQVNNLSRGEDVWQVIINDKYAIKLSEKVAYVKRYAMREIVIDSIFLLFGAGIFSCFAWPRA